MATEDLKELITKFLAALPERERRLVIELANGEFNQTRAMMKAGYSRSTAYKQQTRVINRPRVQQALLAIQYEQEGTDFLDNDDLRLIGLNVRSVRQRERRKNEAERKAEVKVYMDRFFARTRR